jgi:hypothetical protein
VRLSLLTSSTALAASTAILAQDATTDWSVYRQPETRLVVAYVELSSGLSIALRCQGGAFAAVVTGLPAAPGVETVRTLEVKFGDEPARETRWTVGSNRTVALADYPAPMARSFREGGAFSLTVPGGGEGGRDLRYRMTLPASVSAIDEALTTCGKPLVDPRDALIADTGTDGLPDGMTWSRPPRPRFPDGLYAEGFAVISCVVQPDGSLTRCEVESEFPLDGGFGRASLLAMRNARVVSPNETVGAYAPRVIGFRAQYGLR